MDRAEQPSPGEIAPGVAPLAWVPGDLVLRVERDGRVVDAVVPDIRGSLGWAPADLVGRLVTELIHPDSKDAVRAIVVEAFAHDQARGLVQLRTDSGAYRWCVAGVTVQRDGDGVVIGSVASATDVEDLVERIRLLEQSEHRYRLLAEGAADGVAFGRAGVIQWVAGPTTLLMGWSPTELAGRPFRDIVHPADHDAVSRALPEIDGGRSESYEVRLRTKAGDYRWFAFRSDPVRDADGVLIGRVTRWRDADDAKRARERAAELGAQLPTGVDSDRAVVLELAGDVTIRWVSPSVTALVGYPPSEIVGRSVLDLVVDEDRQRLMNAHARRSTTGLSHVDEVRVRTADGNIRWVSATTVEVTDDRGMNLGFVGLIHDVHDRVAARRELAVSEERLRLAMRSAPIGMAVLSLDRRFRVVNPALARLLARDDAWLLTHTLGDVLDEDDDSTDLAHCADLIGERADSVTWDHTVTRPDGSVVWVEHSTALIRDPEGVPREYVVQIVDVTEARRARDALHFEATHDPLTRVGNRRVFAARIGALLAREPRPGGTDALGALLFVDVDRLKEINDRFGHPAGDEVLVRVADRIGRQVRADDVVARLGGDEFAVVMPGMDSLAGALRVADKILGAMAEPVQCDGVPVVVTVSVGVALARAGMPLAEVSQRADGALYRAKRAGRGSAAPEPAGP